MEATLELRSGITGFRHLDDPPLPTCDLRAFRESCHAAARALGGRVISAAITAGSATRANYVGATLELPGGLVSVVLNLHHPVVAFVTPPSGKRSDLEFVEALALAEAFEGSGTHEILTASEAREPVTEQACRP